MGRPLDTPSPLRKRKGISRQEKSLILGGVSPIRYYFACGGRSNIFPGHVAVGFSEAISYGQFSTPVT